MRGYDPAARFESVALRTGGRVRSLSASEVAPFLRDHRAGTAFHRPDWLATMAAAYDRPLVSVGLYDGDVLLAVLSSLVVCRRPLRIAPLEVSVLRPLPFPYYGLVVRDGLAVNDCLPLLDGSLRSAQVALAYHGFRPDTHIDPDALRQHGDTVTRAITYVLPLARRSPEDVLAHASKNVAGTLEKARRCGVTTAASTREEVWQTFPLIMDEVFPGWVWQYPRNAMGLVWDRHHADPSFRMRTAHYNGEAIGMSVAVGDGRRAYLWMHGTLDAHKRVAPSTLLYWDVITWAIEQGYEAFDMVGRVNEGIGAFKRRFGAEERVVYRLRRATWWLPHSVVSVGDELRAVKRLAFRKIGGPGSARGSGAR